MPHAELHRDLYYRPGMTGIVRIYTIAEAIHIELRSDLEPDYPGIQMSPAVAREMADVFLAAAENAERFYERVGREPPQLPR